MSPELAGVIGLALLMVLLFARMWIGAAMATVVASAKALMNALNRLLAVQRRADTEVRTSP